MPRAWSMSILRMPAIAVLGAFTAPAGCDVEADPGFADTDDDDGATTSTDDEDAAWDELAPPTLAAAPLVDGETARACAAYCDAYHDACGHTDAYADEADCRETCSQWELVGQEDPSAKVACHHALLPVAGQGGFGSCIAAGPGSPICSDTRSSAATAGAAAI